jgi:hypothetical protein
MLGALAVAALTIACSAVVGEAIAALLRLERRRGWSPVAGLALLLCVALAAAKLPGHGTMAAIAVALTVAAAIWALLAQRASLRPDADALAAGLLAAAAACIPYVASGRFGIPGVSFNNDASSHLAWATALQDPGLAAVVQPTAGYPVGPHSLMAALSSGTGLDLDHVLAGLLIALPALIAWAALPLLDGLTRPRRALAALLVSSAYLVSAFYAQAGFKELLLIADLLALVGIAREVTRGRLAPSLSTGALTGVLLAGIVVSISYGGLAWPVATLATWAAAATAVALLDGQRRELLARVRASLSPRRGAVAMALGAGIAALLLLAPDVPRLIDSLSLFGSSPAGAGSITNENIGHLAGPLSKYEVFGFWPLADFRFRIAETWRNGALLGLAIAAATFGAVWWSRRRDLAVPSAWAASVALMLYLDRTESAYVASKGFVVAGAFTMLLAARALLASWPARVDLPELRLARAAAVALFVGGALYSSYLVLEGGRVGARAHGDDLATLRATIGGAPTLFMGVDDFAGYELRGVPLGNFSAHPAGKPFAYGSPLDFDSAPASDFDRVRYAIAPRTGYQSEPPPSFRVAATTGSYVLWEREGRTPPRRVLAEGDAPGATLDCSRGAGRRLASRTGWARIWPRPPVELKLPLAARGLPAGSRTTARVALPRGRWELSLQYVSPQAVRLEAPGASLSAPPNMDRPGPWWAVGDVDSRGAPIELEISVDDAPLHSPNQVAEILGLAAAPADARARLVPLRAACGRYVDWYVLGARRPAVPARQASV